MKIHTCRFKSFAQGERGDETFFCGDGFFSLAKHILTIYYVYCYTTNLVLQVTTTYLQKVRLNTERLTRTVRQQEWWNREGRALFYSTGSVARAHARATRAGRARAQHASGSARLQTCFQEQLLRIEALTCRDLENLQSWMVLVNFIY